MILDKSFKLIEFKRSNRKDKKIEAVFKKDDITKSIHFGQRGSSTYKDNTGVGGDPIHNDKKIRSAYRLRHKGEGDIDRKWSAAWLAWHYLWILYIIC